MPFSYTWGVRVVSLIGSILLGLTSSHFLLLWLFFEVNTALFILYLKEDNGPAQGVAIYFIAQRGGSITLIWGLALTCSQLRTVVPLVLAIRALLKLGFPPFHFWFIRVVRSLPLRSIFIIRVPQKILPLFLWTKLSAQSWPGFLILRLLVAAIGILGQLYLKKFLGYSSVLALRWALSVRPVFSLGAIYLLRYGLALLLLLSLTSLKAFNLDKFYLVGGSAWKRVFLLICFLSMAGFPPTVGFFVKIVLLQRVVRFNFFWAALLIVRVPIRFLSYSQLRFNRLKIRSFSRVPLPLTGAAGRRILFVLILALPWFLLLLSFERKYLKLKS